MGLVGTMALRSNLNLLLYHLKVPLWTVFGHRHCRNPLPQVYNFSLLGNGYIKIRIPHWLIFLVELVNSREAHVTWCYSLGTLDFFFSQNLLNVPLES